MKIRWIAHYRDGKTYTSDWDSSISFRDLKSKNISSLQLQDENGNLHTLSSKKKQNCSYWQQDRYINNYLFSRSILKRLAGGIWLKLTLDINGNKQINVIKDTIRMK